MPRFYQTEYFQHTRRRPDRIGITDEWIQHVIDHPEFEEIHRMGGFDVGRGFLTLRTAHCGLSYLRMDRPFTMPFLTATMRRKKYEDKIF